MLFCMDNIEHCTVVNDFMSSVLWYFVVWDFQSKLLLKLNRDQIREALAPSQPSAQSVTG